MFDTDVCALIVMGVVNVFMIRHLIHNTIGFVKKLLKSRNNISREEVVVMFITLLLTLIIIVRLLYIFFDEVDISIIDFIESFKRSLK